MLRHQVIGGVFHNFGLKVALWLPYALTMLFFLIGSIVLKLRYDISDKEMYYVMIFIITYGAFLNISINIRKKYWGLTK